jgi:hypothetical protein
VVGKLEASEGGNLAFVTSAKDEDAQAVMRFAACPIACDHCKVKLNLTGYGILHGTSAPATH